MMRVLVVEDEEMIRKGIVLATDWQSLGCVVVGEAANGEEGKITSSELAGRRGGKMQAVTHHHGPQNAENGRARDDREAARGGMRRVYHHPHGL